jgi:colicin import membrane protein
MNNVILFLMCVLFSAVSSAQTSHPTETPTPEARQAEGQRLTALRQQLEETYQQEIKACYQNFDVTSCRIQARERRIQANAALRKEELRHNASERRIQAAESVQRTEEKTSDAKIKEAQAQRAEAIQAAKDRADANAQKQIDHELQGTKRGAYEQKQRDAAQHRADVEKKLRERTKEPAAPLPVPNK